MKNKLRSFFRFFMRLKVIMRLLSVLNNLGLLPEYFWRRIPIEFDFVVQTPDKKSFNYSSVAYDNIGRALFWKGWNGFEPETTSVYYELAQESKVIFDIGANTGLFALLACVANEEGKIYAFEPVTNIVNLLKHNVKLNNFSDQCTVLSLALSDEVGTAPFSVIVHDLHDVPTSSSLHPQGYRGNKADIIEVEVSTVDAIYSRFELESIDLIKIDVEGFEDKVLAGMEQVLSAHHPIIIVECNPDGPYKIVEDIVKKHGYSIFHLSNRGVEPVDKIIPDLDEEFRNFLCLVK